MNWYPWLKSGISTTGKYVPRRAWSSCDFVACISRNGADALSCGLSRWLMCQNKQGSKSCNECHSCRLMLAETHPDWHILQNEKGKSSIGIEAVRKVTESLSTMHNKVAHEWYG